MGRDENTVYTIHLKADPSTRDSLPIETERIDYYDSGLWVHVDEGRDFYPYERIEVIQERERLSEDESSPDEDADIDEEDAGTDDGYVDLEDTVDEAEGDEDEDDDEEDEEDEEEA